MLLLTKFVWQHFYTNMYDSSHVFTNPEFSICYVSRAVARSENLGGLVVQGGDNVPPLVEIGLTDLPKTGGLKPPPSSPLHATALCLVFLQEKKNLIYKVRLPSYNLF